MSFFMLYFETSNPNAINYSGFSDVGKFTLPKHISAGSMTVEYAERQYKAGIVSDDGHWCVNKLFLKDGANLRSDLKDFIRVRLNNDCIVANLSGYMEPNEDVIPSLVLYKSIAIEELLNEIQYENFMKGRCIEIKK